QYDTGRRQQILLEHGLGQLHGTVHQLTAEVRLQLIVRVEVQGLLGELVEDAELVQRTFAGETGEADTVHAATVLGQQRQLGGDGAHVAAGTVQVAVHEGDAIGVDALVVDVAVVEQRHVLVDLDRLAEVLRHVDRAGEG